MVVITFQPRFADLVEHGSKPHTIRGERKRPIKPGDALSLRTWTGRPYMSPQRVLRPPTPCLSVIPIRVSWTDTGRPILLGADVLTPDQATALAIADGFASSADLVDWFDRTHGLPFHGVLIRWALWPWIGDSSARVS